MALRFTSVFSDSSLRFTVVTPDDADLLCGVARKVASSFVGSTKASVTTPGTTDKQVTIEARYGGTHGNSITYIHESGDTGAGHEDRSLAVAVTSQEVRVVYGTDGSGNSVVPTAGAVRDLVNGDPDASKLVVATLPGTGAGAVDTCAPTLEGGLEDGDCLKWLGSPPVLTRIHGVESI